MTDPAHYMSKLPAATAYPTSKTALNSLTVQYAKALTADHILVNAVAPGACATDFTKGLPFPITRTAAQGAEIAVRLATIGPDGPTGGFFDDDGPVPWWPPAHIAFALSSRPRTPAVAGETESPVGALSPASRRSQRA
jgi:NAD(P)-dependent dehydrogenase (short-subunit alcohol dehydrogenase family)